MKRVGLTGSIATGKSTVLKAIAAEGVPVFSSDEAVHELYAGEAVPLVDALFPGVGSTGTIDRNELSRRLIAEPHRLAELEAVVHPLVRKRIARFLDEAESAGAKLAVVDIPLLFESGHDWGFDEVWVTAVDPAEQRRRFALEMDEKQRLYGERYPLDEDFLAALALMHPAAGIAMGFDRVVMLATGAPRIDDVIWAPVPE